MDERPGGPPPDLRSRKRRAAMGHIQRVALDLFDEQGYDHVTIARIAEAAEVGERSIYRYFGSKPMLVLHDDIDRHVVDRFADLVRGRDLLDAVHLCLDEIGPMLTGDAMHDARRRLELVREHRELQAALAVYVNELGDALGRAIADATGRAGDDLPSRVHGRCVAAALDVAIEDWYRHDGACDLLERLRLAADGLRTLAARSEG